MLVAVAIAAVALMITQSFGGPVMLYALLLGMIFGVLKNNAKLTDGVDFAASQILRIGVALLGLRITLGEVASLGLPIAVLVIAGIIVTFGAGAWVGRAFGLKMDHSILSAGAVAICGASAALAISAVLPKHKDSECNTILTVFGVTALSTIAMVIYPVIAGALDLSDREAGIFIGSTIHDVAQVVGAGYTISNEAGDTATIVKLMRVACLVPVIFVIGLVLRGSKSEAACRATPILPFFLIAFVVFVILNSAGVVPAPLQAGLSEMSRWALVTAVAALGMKTSLSDLFKVGAKPVAVLTLQTLMLGAFSLAALILVINF